MRANNFSRERTDRQAGSQHQPGVRRVHRAAPLDARLFYDPKDGQKWRDRCTRKRDLWQAMTYISHGSLTTRATEAQVAKLMHCDRRTARRGMRDLLAQGFGKNIKKHGYKGDMERELLPGRLGKHEPPSVKRVRTSTAECVRTSTAECVRVTALRELPEEPTSVSLSHHQQKSGPTVRIGPVPQAVPHPQRVDDDVVRSPENPTRPYKAKPNRDRQVEGRAAAIAAFMEEQAAKTGNIPDHYQRVVQIAADLIDERRTPGHLSNPKKFYLVALRNLSGDDIDGINAHLAYETYITKLKARWGTNRCTHGMERWCCGHCAFPDVPNAEGLDDAASADATEVGEDEWIDF